MTCTELAKAIYLEASFQSCLGLRRFRRVTRETFLQRKEIQKLLNARFST